LHHSPKTNTTGEILSKMSLLSMLSNDMLSKDTIKSVLKMRWRSIKRILFSVTSHSFFDMLQIIIQSYGGDYHEFEEHGLED